MKTKSYFIFIYLGIPFKRISSYFEVTSGLRLDQIIREIIILSKWWEFVFPSELYLKPIWHFF